MRIFLSPKLYGLKQCGGIEQLKKDFLDFRMMMKDFS